MSSILTVEELVTHFPITAGILRRQVGKIHALDGVSLELSEGETIGVVGESGSGKTTLGRSIIRLVEPTSGSVRFRDEEVTTASKPRMRELRKEMQIVFQDPFASLNPRMPIRETVAEPLRIHGLGRKDAHQKSELLLESVGLSPELGNRYPHEFSGGQRQRIGIARALALDPQVIVLDEPVSALDVSVQAQVLNLLEDLQGELGLSYLFIAHDLSVVRHISDRIYVMYLGKVVEEGPGDSLYEQPAHPYTQALLSAVPVPDPEIERSRQRIVLEGDLPSPASPPPGCRFSTRCPLVQEVCIEVEPPLTPIGDGRRVSCHFPLVAV